MELGSPIYSADQTLKVKDKKDIKIASLSIPIRAGNRIVGAIDLSSSKVESKENTAVIEIDSAPFKIPTVKNLYVNKSFAPYSVDNIISNNNKMLALKDYIEIAANCDLPVMIYGETGTGKELFAQAIHNASKRKNAPFIAQNCAAIPDNLLESILFGTAKGAFTGAIDNIGLLELADGGSLFLDEINSMPVYLQPKLLRVLQDGTFRSIGSKEVKKVDVKIISTLNIEPNEAIKIGELRRDIYYRLSVMLLNIPPLRDRLDDIPLLVNHYIIKYNKVFDKNIKYVSKKLYTKLTSYDWPGNIRELEHIIVYGLSTVKKTNKKLMFSDIEYKFKELTSIRDSAKEFEIVSLKENMDNYEKSLIEKALLSSEHNVTMASKLLNIPRQTLQRKVNYYKI
ncbi:sigma 54-interacting transcriptional regulator [Clostridium sp.]|uniref:sigma-54 interaction domain-containing protein n=1 Tax=Clostridium sp. TaxID=1506 RepID=UPI0025BFFFAD|nr:sigma 54-interacting transcriptional regulator [Clostridium sp.]